MGPLLSMLSFLILRAFFCSLFFSGRVPAGAFPWAEWRWCMKRWTPFPRPPIDERPSRRPPSAKVTSLRCTVSHQGARFISSQLPFSLRTSIVLSLRSVSPPLDRPAFPLPCNSLAFSLSLSFTPLYLSPSLSLSLPLHLFLPLSNLHHTVRCESIHQPKHTIL